MALRSADVSWTDTREPFGQVKWIFIQLPGFDKKPEELDSDLERWIYLMKQLHLIQKRPAFFNNTAFRKLFNVTEIDKLNPEEQKMYKLTIDADRNWRNVISYAKYEEKLIFAETLIRDTSFNDQKIAALVGVEECFVRQVRAKVSAYD
ncbi:hypothetical protein FRZ59_11450 [Anseongella ginsenosidimutans]|nr:hypothetical protein FRZ59_11450 [Anseongella ginsenosidimutans]